MKNSLCKTALLAIGIILVSYSTVAQMPMIPDPMRGVPNPTPLAYPNPFPAGYLPPPLPPGVRDPVAAIMPRIPMEIRPDENPYNYALANPTNLTDPTGLSPGIITGFPQTFNPSGNSQCSNNGNETQVSDVIFTCYNISALPNSCIYWCENAGITVEKQRNLGIGCPSIIRQGS